MKTSAELPGRVTGPETGPGHSLARRREAGIAAARPRGARKVLRTVVSVALIAAIFGFALPRFASYRSVWASIEAMTWPQVLLVATADAARLASAWFINYPVKTPLRTLE